jgi:hypothetical protein
MLPTTACTTTLKRYAREQSNQVGERESTQIQIHASAHDILNQQILTSHDASATTSLIIVEEKQLQF